MTLTEQQEMIARFMGHTGRTRVSNDKIVPYLATYDIWQTLMPVVEKIDSMVDTGVCIHIDEDRVFAHLPKEMKSFINKEEGSKIAAVYKAVCTIINFLEKQNKAKIL